MKKYLICLLLLSTAFNLSAQTLFSFGSNKVDKEEFLHAYNKNKTPVADKEQSIREYLDLYVNFKLKVKAAQEKKYDTLPQLKEDLENFRQQVQENYMSDEAVTKSLLSEAFQRSQKDLHIWHFSVTNENDSVAGMAAANTLYNKLAAGNSDYAGLTTEASALGSVAKNRDLGYLTVFSIAYPLENIIYGLKPGEVSKPYRSKNTWHVFKLVSERPSAGKWRVSQIMLALPPDPSAAVLNELQKKADSIYDLLLKGADFAIMAKVYSEDKLTYQNGGEMAEFGTGRYENSFEQVVFALKRDGEISKPFRTSIGIHIVKRLSQTPTPADATDAALSYDLRQKLMEDARINIAREKLAKDIMAKTVLKINPAITNQELSRYADSVMANVDNTDDDRFAFSKKTILTFQKGSKKGSDWMAYVRQFNTAPVADVKDLFPKFQRWATLEYYKEHMEDYNEEFRSQIQEFREGNMLFEAMERNVWGKAATDTIGLQKYYSQHKENYKWAESADMLVINAPSKMEADWTVSELQKGTGWKELISENAGEAQIDSGRYELAQIAAAVNVNNAERGSFSPYLKNPDSSITFVRFLKGYPANEQRSFDDARGMVINDYQIVLEKQWLDELKKKYPVTVNQEVLASLLK